MKDLVYRKSVSVRTRWHKRGCLDAVGLVLTLMMLCLYSASAESKEYTWIPQCDAEIGATVPAFECLDVNNLDNHESVEAPKTMDGDKCARPEDLNTRCVHKSRVGRLLPKPGEDQNVEMIFSCRKSKFKKKASGEIMRDASGNGILDLHENDTTNKFWDVAVIQYNRKTGKTCFYQHLGDGDKDDVTGAPASNSAKGRKFWNFDNLSICTGCHTNGPFIRSPHYWDLIKDAKGKRFLPNVRDKKKKDLPYQVVHAHHPVANVEITDNNCNGCHNVGAFFLAGEWHMGLINRLAAGTIHSLKEDPSDIYEPHEASPTKTGYHDFMVDRTGDPKKALEALEACLKGQPEKLDQSQTNGCKLTKVTPLN